MFENRIIVLSPVHNEGATLELTLEAVIKQTVLPIAWVFVMIIQQITLLILLRNGEKNIIGLY